MVESADDGAGAGKALRLARLVVEVERVDGRGYPSRMSGNAIPLASRIIQICDAYVAMSSRRSYQAPFTPQDARRRVLEGAGTQFDDALVQKFVRMLPEIAL